MSLSWNSVVLNLILRAGKCIFLGFKIGTKVYVVFDLSTREISRNAAFYESTFPYAVIDYFLVSIDSAAEDYSIFLFDDPSDPATCNIPLSASQTVPSPTTAPISTAAPLPPHIPNSNQNQTIENTNLRRSYRTTKAPRYLKDSIVNLNLKLESLPQT